MASEMDRTLVATEHQTDFWIVLIGVHGVVKMAGGKDIPRILEYCKERPRPQAVMSCINLLLYIDR